MNVRAMIFAPTTQPIGRSDTDIELDRHAGFITVVVKIDIDLTSSWRHLEPVFDGMAAVRRRDDAGAINLDWERWRVSRWRDHRRRQNGRRDHKSEVNAEGNLERPRTTRHPFSGCIQKMYRLCRSEISGVNSSFPPSLSRASSFSGWLCWAANPAGPIRHTALPVDRFCRSRLPARRRDDDCVCNVEPGCLTVVVAASAV
jgi:hypothetical protein